MEFKIGDKVIIKSDNVSPINGHFKKGDVGVIVCKYDEGFIINFNGTRQVISDPKRFEEIFEKFVEPKYKIGYKFITTHRNLEIVQRAYNKKCKEYNYLCFDINDGYGVVFNEYQIDQAKELGKEKKVKEMTVGEISKKLGYEIKIIK